MESVLQHRVIKSHTSSEGSKTPGSPARGRDGRSPPMTRFMIFRRLVESLKGAAPECIYCVALANVT
jgi:hypothetical protein